MNEKKRKHYLLAAVIFIAAYLFIVLLTIHTMHIRIEMPYLDFFSSVAQGALDIVRHPLRILPFAPGTGNAVLGVTLVIASSQAVLSIDAKLREHDDPDTVQGDARWMTELDDYNRKFTEPLGETSNDGQGNMIFSQDIYLSMEHPREVKRNLNALVIGGSGAGKSFNYVGPNLMQANCSFVVTDPSGGLLKSYGKFFERRGYKVKCLNLSHMERGNHYNPFRYIHSNKDVVTLVTTLVSNTTPPETKSSEPFWENSEKLLLIAIISYLFNYTERQCQNFSNVMRLLREAKINEFDAERSTLDYIFEEVKALDPEGFAVKNYEEFKTGAAKTLQSILISVMVRLKAFDLEDVENLTDTDDIDLDMVGNEKTALFVILPTGEGPFNFLASMMYSQLFHRAYDYAENTAEFSQLVMDGDGQLVRCFRAETQEESKERKKEAEAFLEKAKQAAIRRCETTGLYEVVTEDGELVCFRGTRKAARKALLSITEGGYVLANRDRSNDGLRLPVHLRLLLDEFANIGKIPEFEKKVATVRKYEISVAIILQSLSQLQNMYEKNWSELAGNCDTTLYLGGGADTVTAKWISELLGKETRIVMNVSYGRGGGSTSLNRQGVELLAPAQLRVLPDDECIVIPKSLYAYKGKKYMTPDHPRWEEVKKCGPYYWSRDKARYFEEEAHRGDPIEEEEPVPEAPMPEGEEIRAEQNRENRQRAEEYRSNLDAAGDPLIDGPKPLGETELAAPGSFSEGGGVRGTIREAADTFEKNEIIWREMAVVYSSAPAESVSSSA